MAYISKSETARRLGCTRQAVQKWRATGVLTEDHAGRVDFEAAQILAKRRRRGRRMKGELRVWDDELPNRRWEAALRRRNDFYFPVLGGIIADSEQEAARRAALSVLAHVLSPAATTQRILPILPLPPRIWREMALGKKRPTLVFPKKVCQRVDRLADAGGSYGDTAGLLKLWCCCRFYPCQSLLRTLPIESRLSQVLAGASPRAIVAIAAQIVERACRTSPPRESALLITGEEKAALRRLYGMKLSASDKRCALEQSRYARRLAGRHPMRAGAVRGMVTLHALLGCNRAMAKHWRTSTENLLRRVTRLEKSERPASGNKRKLAARPQALFDLQLEGAAKSEDKLERWGYDTGTNDVRGIRCGKCKRKLQSVTAPCPHCQPT